MPHTEIVLYFCGRLIGLYAIVMAILPWSRSAVKFLIVFFSRQGKCSAISMML